MSINLPIIVYGNGELFRECFTAIANIFGATAFAAIFRIALLLAGMAALFSLITKRDLMQCLRWFGRYYLVYYVLFGPKLDIYIADHLAQQKLAVSGVPLGLAIFASYTTTIGSVLTQLVEDQLNFGNDFSGLNYSNSGMLLAARMIIAANQFQIGNLQLITNTQSFIKNCLKANWNDLMIADDLYKALFQSEVKVGNFTYNGEITSCTTGNERFSNDLNLEIDRSAAKYGKWLFPQAIDSTVALKQALFLSYHYLLNISGGQDQGVQQVMRQVLLANLIQTEIAKMSLTPFSQNMGMRISAWLPLAQSIAEIVLYACFMLVVVLALFPYGTMVLKNYILLLLWLQTWSPLYVIINYIGTIYAKDQVTGTVFNLQFLSHLTQVNAEVLTLVGYLSLVIPCIALGLIRSLTQFFAQLTQQKIITSPAILPSENVPTGLSANNSNLHD